MQAIVITHQILDHLHPLSYVSKAAESVPSHNHIISALCNFCEGP